MVKLLINKSLYELDLAADVPLLWALRDQLKLKASKYGCGIGMCGACTVHVNGVPKRSCMLKVGDLSGREITTLEGANSLTAEKIRQAWLELQVPQCGYCQSGQIMSAIALLESNPAPDDRAINAAMSGNICRCGTYPKIRRAIHRAAGQD